MSKSKYFGSRAAWRTCRNRCRPSGDKQPLTVMGSIEMRRVLDPFEPVALSPNGQRFVIRLARDDLDQNGTWVEMIAGELDSLSTGARMVATLFTTSELDRDTGRKSPVYPGRTKVAWLDDNERVAFVWNDGASPTQVYTLNVRTGEVATLTNHPTSIEDFTVVPGGNRVVYVAAIDRARLRAERFERARRDGLVVSATHVLPILEGNLDREFDQLDLAPYVADAKGSSRVVRCEKTIRCKWMRFAPEHISPDGKYAITMKAPAAVIPDEWSAYGEAELQRDIVAARKNPDAYGLAHRINRIGILDLDRAELKSLVDAPVYITGWSPKLDWAPVRTSTRQDSGRRTVRRRIARSCPGSYHQSPA